MKEKRRPKCLKTNKASGWSRRISFRRFAKGAKAAPPSMTAFAIWLLPKPSQIRSHQAAIKFGCTEVKNSPRSAQQLQAGALFLSSNSMLLEQHDKNQFHRQRACKLLSNQFFQESQSVNLFWPAAGSSFFFADNLNEPGIQPSGQESVGAANRHA